MGSLRLAQLLQPGKTRPALTSALVGLPARAPPATHTLVSCPFSSSSSWLCCFACSSPPAADAGQKLTPSFRVLSIPIISFLPHPSLRLLFNQVKDFLEQGVGFHPDPSRQELSVGAQSGCLLATAPCFSMRIPGFPLHRALGLQPPPSPHASPARGSLLTCTSGEGRLEAIWEMGCNLPCAHSKGEARKKTQTNKKIPHQTQKKLFPTQSTDLMPRKHFVDSRPFMPKKPNGEIKGKGQRKDNFFLAFLISLSGFHLSAFKMSFN